MNELLKIPPGRVLFLFLLFSATECISQGKFPHQNAHAHNDYEHARPLAEALQNGFISVEADVHLRKGNLVVAHNHATDQSPSLEILYLAPLDSILSANNGQVYSSLEKNAGPFYLMIDIKTEAEAAYISLKKILLKYPLLQNKNGPVKIFLSGNRPVSTLQQEVNSAIGIDGRPADLGKGFSAVFMPVISDHYKNWSHWNGKSVPTEKDLADIKVLAARVHAEGKKLRLWAIPDSEKTWGSLLDAGVDLISTDHLEALNQFLAQKGL